jgi:hypothetical protein
MCRVQCPLDNEQLEIVWWEKGKVVPPLCPVMYGNLHRCKVEELFDCKGCIIHHSNVIDVVFVFSPDALKQFWVDNAGMMNVFLMRGKSCLFWYSGIRKLPALDLVLYPSCAG